MKFKIKTTFILAVTTICVIFLYAVIGVGEEVCPEGNREYAWTLPITSLIVCGGFFIAGIFAGRESK